MCTAIYKVLKNKSKYIPHKKSSFIKDGIDREKALFGSGFVEELNIHGWKKN